MATEKFNIRLRITVCLYILLGIALPYACSSQGTAINPSGTAPHSSAMLDVNTTASPFGGVLITRMTTAQRDSIASPAQSLLIYNTTTKCFEFFEYGYWQSLYCAASYCPLGSYPAQGGIAFLSSGGKCYVVATTDQSSGAEWGCSGTSIAGALGTAVGTGKANTDAIIVACSTSGIAARVCKNYNGGGFTDWFLPSKDEFTALRPYITPSQGFTWTSSESSATVAWHWWYGTGYFNFDSMTNFSTKSTATNFVRCIRSF